MSEQWYWKHGRELRGPFDTENLEQLIHQHRVGDHDQVRLAGDETWLSGADVKELFVGGERTASSSEAAARLLSQARRLQDPESNPRASTNSWLRRLRVVMRRVIQRVGGPAERIGDALDFGLRLALRHTRKLIGLAAAVLAAVTAMNLTFDGDSRHRRVHAQLAEIWQALEHLRTAQPATAELRAFVDAQLPDIQHELDVLIVDSQRAPGRSADSFARLYSTERNWNAAHTRNALIQASLAMRSLLQQSTVSDASPERIELFQQHMSIAEQRLNNRPGPMMPASATIDGVERHHDGTKSLVAGVVVLDVAVVAVALWYWRRSRR